MSPVIGMDFSRRCAHVDERGRCITIRNKYNPGPFCLAHATVRWSRARREFEDSRLYAELTESAPRELAAA